MEKPSFSEMYKANYAGVVGFLSARMWGSDIALDLADDTMSSAFENWERFEYHGPGPTFVWLCQIAKRRRIDFLRKFFAREFGFSDVFPDFDEGDGTVSPPEESFLGGDLGLPELEVLKAEGMKVLYDALGRLRPADRQALVLRLIDEKGYDEMARMVKAAEATMRQRVSRARQRITEMAGDELKEYMEIWHGEFVRYMNYGRGLVELSQNDE